jgi:hypothetical protein
MGQRRVQGNFETPSIAIDFGEKESALEARQHARC